jgi:hypothetical protein
MQLVLPLTPPPPAPPSPAQAAVDRWRHAVAPYGSRVTFASLPDDLRALFEALP